MNFLCLKNLQLKLQNCSINVNYKIVGKFIKNSSPELKALICFQFNIFTTNERQFAMNIQKSMTSWDHFYLFLIILFLTWKIKKISPSRPWISDFRQKKIGR